MMSEPKEALKKRMILETTDDLILKFTPEFVKTSKECPVWDGSGWCFSKGVGNCKKGAVDFKDCPTYNGFRTGFFCGYEHYWKEMRRQQRGEKINAR